MESDGPVTVVMRHSVRKGSIPEFEEWLRGSTKAAVEFQGYLGFNVIRPTNHGRPEYLIFLRFDNFENLQQWEELTTRHEWLERVKQLTIRKPTWEKHTGLEVWFSPPLGCALPPRHKMIVVTLLAIYPLILLVQLTLAPHLMTLPLMVRTLLRSALLVCLMTYVVMPAMTRLFSPWLYHLSDESPDQNVA